MDHYQTLAVPDLVLSNAYLERLGHDDAGEDGWPLRKLADKLVEELLGRNLQLEGVAAVFDERVEELRFGGNGLVRSQSRHDA